jgi:osmotically-inducible protein OsmY
MLTNSRQIENEVRSALQRDRRVKHPELIAVSVDEIGTVVLRGAVETLDQRHAAAHDAKQIDGVFDVIDHLKVHPGFPDRRSDDEIRAAALQRLVSNSRIHADAIHVNVSQGRVILTGHARHQSQRAAAEQEVASLTGVLEVINRIEVR